MKVQHIVSAVVAGALISGGAVVQAAGVAYRNTVLADAPVAYWQIDESSGTVANNIGSAGAAVNGTYAGVTLNQAGLPALNTAGAFDGSTSRVRIPDNAAFQVGTGAFSIEAWFRPVDNNRGDIFTYKGGGGDFGVHWSSQTAGKVSVWHNGYIGLGTAGTAAAGAWHHVVVTREAAGAFTIYLDGVSALTGTDTQNFNAGNDLLIGSNFGGDITIPAIVFNGLIDEVAFYNTALSAGQVATHFAAGTVVPEPATIAGMMIALLAGAGVYRRSRAAA